MPEQMGMKGAAMGRTRAHVVKVQQLLMVRHGTRGQVRVSNTSGLAGRQGTPLLRALGLPVICTSRNSRVQILPLAAAVLAACPLHLLQVQRPTLIPPSQTLLRLPRLEGSTPRLLLTQQRQPLTLLSHRQVMGA